MIRPPSPWWLVAMFVVGCSSSDRVFAVEIPDGATDASRDDGGASMSDGSDAGVPIPDAPGSDFGAPFDGPDAGPEPGDAGIDIRMDVTVPPDAAISKYCIYDLDKYDSDCVYAP